MKISRDGKPVENATVIYTTTGTPDLVRIKGVDYAASAFKIEEDEKQTKNTKPAPKTVERKDTVTTTTNGTLTTTETPIGKPNDTVMTTRDVKTKK